MMFILLENICANQVNRQTADVALKEIYCAMEILMYDQIMTTREIPSNVKAV